MQLQLAVIAFQSAHLDNAGLLQVNESELFLRELFHVLDHSGKSVYQVDNVIALVENLIDSFACIGDLALQAELYHV